MFRRITLFVLIFSGSSLSAQNYDTNYIAKYPSRLVLGIYQSWRQFDIQIRDIYKQDSIVIGQDTLKFNPLIGYKADANHATGISFDYDIIGFSLDYRSVAENDPVKYGKTTYSSFAVNFNSKGLRFENSYRRYTGFYDYYSGSYTHSDTLYQNSSMSMLQLRSRIIYFFKNRKFSLSSAYANTARQLKSAFTWTLQGGVYGTTFHSDTGLFPEPRKFHYDSTMRDWNSLRIIGVNAGGGLAFNLVAWKRVYFSLMLNGMFEYQHKKYSTEQSSFSNFGAISFANDSRVSVGYNASRFFMRFAFRIDKLVYESKSKDVTVDHKYWLFEGSLGYRFKMKTPKFYRKFQETKFYQRWF